MTILEKVNILILLVTISYIMALTSLLFTIDDIPTQMAWLITLLTSVGLFRLLIILVYWLINRSDLLLALYHREKLVKGLWTYRYEANGRCHAGIWRTGPTDIRAQSVLYSYEEEGVRHAELILKRAATGLSEREIMEKLTTKNPMAKSKLAPVPLYAGLKSDRHSEENR